MLCAYLLYCDCARFWFSVIFCSAHGLDLAHSYTACIFFNSKLSSYGGERYEKRDLQLRVRKRFDELREADAGSINWHMIDAAQSMEDVQKDINAAVMKTLDQVKAGKPLGKLWMEGEYDLIKAAVFEDKDN